MVISSSVVGDNRIGLAAVATLYFTELECL